MINHAVAGTIFGGLVTPSRMDAYHGCVIRGALTAGEGELWVAEVDSPTDRRREIVGVAVWWLPGARFLGSERQRRAVRWDEFLQLAGREQELWYKTYYVPVLERFWEQCLRETGDKVTDSYYLHLLGVRPDWQNRGITTPLVAPVMTRALTEGRRLLGAATTATNTDKYVHVGCKVLGVQEFWVPGSGEPYMRYALDFIPGSFEEKQHWRQEAREPTRVLARL